jgi:hypothetical protein
LAAALSSTTLMRWGGLAAVLAGVLRAAVSFWPSSDPAIALELLYLLIDILTLFGILGVYGFLGEQSGVAGFLGFLLAVVGTAIITGPDGEIGEVDMYAAGSAVFAIGLVFLAVGSWKAGRLPHWVPVLWVLAAVLGFVGGSVEGPDGLLGASGVIFGASFVGAGVRVWSNADSTAPKTPSQ